MYLQPFWQARWNGCRHSILSCSVENIEGKQKSCLKWWHAVKLLEKTEVFCENLYTKENLFCLLGLVYDVCWGVSGDVELTLELSDSEERFSRKRIQFQVAEEVASIE